MTSLILLIGLAAQTDLSVEPERLATVPEEASVTAMRFSPDGRAAAYIGTEDKKYFVGIGDDVGESFDVVHSLSYAPELGTFEYVAGRTSDKRWFIMQGDKPVVECDMIMVGAASRNGLVRMHQGRVGKSVFAVLNGRKGEDVDGVEQFITTPSGSVYAYRAHKNGRSWVVINGVEGERFSTVDSLRFREDGETVTYSAQRRGDYFSVLGTQRSERASNSGDVPILSLNGRTSVTTDYKSVTVNGVKGEAFGSVQEIQVSRDGERVAHVASFQGMRVIVVDGILGEPFTYVGAPVFSADGKTVAYHARNDDRTARTRVIREHFVVVNEERSEPFDDIRSGPFLSADGSTVAFVARKGGKEQVVINGKQSVPMTSVQELIWSPDGRRVAYAGWDERQHYVGGLWPDDRKEPGACDRLQFGPDGRILTYRIVKGERRVLVIGNARSPEFDDIGEPQFSEDGKRVGFGVRDGDELRWEVMEIE